MPHREPASPRNRSPKTRERRIKRPPDQETAGGGSGGVPRLLREKGSPECRTQDRLRTGRATSEQSRERLNICTGERPATAQGGALAAAQGSALALSIRSAATSHRHGLRASAGRERAATVPAPTAALVSKTF